MYKGSCLCGEIAFTIGVQLGSLMACHCQRCKKENGTAYLISSAVPRSSLNLVRGDKYLTRYVGPTGFQRFFCNCCGSPIFSQNPANPEVIRVRIGSLDTVVQDQISKHIYLNSAAPWETSAISADRFLEKS